MMEYCLIGIIWLTFIVVLLILPLLVLVLVGGKRDHRKKAVRISLALLCAEILMTVILCIHPLLLNLSGNVLNEESENTIFLIFYSLRTLNWRVFATCL